MRTWTLDKIVRQQNDMTREAVQATIACDGRRALEALDRGRGRIAELAEPGDRRAAMARDYAALSPRDRARTLVMDTTRKGRELLTDAIRAELRRDGTIKAEGITASTLESKGLTREEARHARGYEPGDVVTFRRDYDRHVVEKGQAYRVERIDRDGNQIEQRNHEGSAISWRLDNGAGGRRIRSRKRRASSRAGTGCSSPATTARRAGSTARPRP